MNFDPQPGDIVTIRTWDDMVEEYGLNESGGIKTPYLTILRGMKQYCGHSYSVVRAYDTFDKRSYSFYGVPFFTSLSVLLSVILPPHSPFPFPQSLLIPSFSLSPPPERTTPMKQFFQTDPDTRQFCRALSPTTYQFTDIVPFHSKSASPNRNYYAVAAETIDLSAYTIRQLEQAVEPYYCSLRGLVSAYGSDTTLPEILQIIAECVFENIETPKLVSPAADYPRAVSYQRQWISRQESTPGLPKTMFKSLTDSAAAS